MPPVKLSALIIAKDEETDLPACLESLKGLADEVVVLVDDASRDGTEELARRFGARVARRRFDDYARQRQAALELCSGEWTLWIDCDERLAPGAAKEISRVLAAPPPGVSGFKLPFQVHFLGKRLRFGGLGRESHLRLFRTKDARFAGGKLHEGLELAGGRARLPAPVVHVPYRDLGDYLSKLERYTALAAAKKFEAGKRFHFWHHLTLPWEFFSRAILRLGALDGHAGLVWAGLSAFHGWLKYVRLRELEKKR